MTRRWWAGFAVEFLAFGSVGFGLLALAFMVGPS